VSIATVTTIQASLKETLSFVRYHLRAGVDHMYLFFDDPQDGAFPRLRNHARLTCVRCTQDHWESLGVEDPASVQRRQKANATHAFRQAKEAGIDWVAHIDSDEFLWTSQSLRDHFAAMSPRVDVVLFPVLEAVPQQLEYQNPFREISLFKYFPCIWGDNPSLMMSTLDQARYWGHTHLWRRKKQIATALGCEHSQIVGCYLLGHMVGKSATRTTASVDVLANHRPVPPSKETLRASVATEAAVAHFDCRGFSQWGRKCARRVEGTADFDTSRFAPHRRKQLRQFRETYSEEGDRALQRLYERWYFVPDVEKNILGVLGLIKNIDISHPLYDKI